MFIKRFATCLLVLAAFGCQTDSNTILPDPGTSPNTERTSIGAQNLRLKTMTVTGNNNGLGPGYINTYFDYAQGRQLGKVTVPTDTYAGITTFNYTYDEQGRVTGVRYLRETPLDNGIRGQQKIFKYTDSTIVETNLQVHADGTLIPYPTEPNNKSTYRLNAQGQIYEQFNEGIVKWGNETTELIKFTYENGNVTKYEVFDAYGQLELTLTYEYDDKINPFYQNTYMFNATEHCSKNNIVATRVRNNEPQRTEYTYNEQGLPITKKNVSQGAVLTYEYESF